MSGYRSLHREQVLLDKKSGEGGGGAAVWCVASSPLLVVKKKNDAANRFRAWVAGSSDGCVRSYVVEETSLENKKVSGADSSSLDASAAQLTFTHILEGGDPNACSSIGCSRVCTARNYVGQDTSAGNLIVVSLDLVGTLRVWELEADTDDHLILPKPTTSSPKRLRARHETQLTGACGTTLALQRPAVEGQIAVAVGCLDGTVAMVSTGLVTPKFAGKTVPEFGTIIDTLGSRGSSIPLCLCWKPTSSAGSGSSLAVGRQDGVVDIMNTSSRSHRLVRHSTPVRAATYTPDGHLLITGSDQGLVCVWDTSRTSHVALVHHLQSGYSSWILHVTAFEDSRRFITCCQNGTLSVWNLEHANQVTHTFASDHAVYTCCTVEGRPRLVAGNDDGWVQLYSTE